METPNDYYDRELDPVGFNQKKKVEASEQRAMINMIQYPRVSEYFDSMKKHFEQPLRQVALALSPDKKYLMDKYLPANILKMFNGLEIHNLNKAFSKFQNEITLETFIVIGFRILDIPKNESPYVLFGMMNLYHSLTTNKGKKTLSFRDFLNNFIRIQSMFSEHKGYVNEENKTIRFLPSSIQDNSHHENPIRNAYYSKSLKLLFSLDEGADHIRVYTANAEFKARINPDKRNHFSRSVIIIMDFAWSETRRKIGICFQDLKLGFFSYEDNFMREEVYSTDTLHTDIWYIEFCGYWFSTDVAHNLYYWDSTYSRSKITGRSKAKVSNVSEIASLGLIAISSYDKKISFFNPTKNVIVLTITQDDCSAHTLKYSKEQNLFFAATFGQMVRIYQIDKSRDYTKIGKLESPAATTAIDILDNQKMILTCDDEGNLKSWDSQNFKSLQHYVLHSSCPITKIIGMEDMGKFCTVTNRLNMFDFTHVTANSDKNQQVVPFVRYCAEKEEIIVALNNDIRVFSLRYGILSELYDKELYNVDETKRISYFKKSAKGDNTFFVDHKGFVRQLTVATNAKANQGFQPFKSDNGNFIFYEPDNLLVTWHRNNLAIYRYETNTHTHLLLRSITFPEVYQFTGVKIYRSKGVLATIINNSCLVFWEFHKLNICGVFVNYDDTLKIELDDSPYMVGHGDIRSPRTRSPSYAIQIPSIIRDNHSNTTSNASGGMSPLRKKQTEEKTFSLKIKFTESAYQNLGETGTQEEKFVPKPVVNNSGSEILDLLFIENYNCFVLIDGKYDIYLVEQKGFEEFGAKVKLNLASRVQSLDYYYVKAKVKAIDFKPLIEEKAIRLPEIAHLYVEPESNDKDEDIQYLLFLCDSENQLIILNLNEVLQKYFKPATNDLKFKQPYFSTKVELHDIDVQKLLTKGKQGIKVGQNKAVEDIPMSKINVWKAGDSPVLDSKVVIFNTIVIITISQNYLLQIWNIKGELIGQLHIKDTKCSIWDLNQYNVHQRVEVFQKTMDIFNDIYNKYQKEIHTGCDNLLDKKFSDKIRQELIDSEPKNTKSIRETRIRRTLIVPAFVPNFVEEEIKEEEKATVKANYVLNRDRKLLVRKKSVDETFDQDNSGIEALQKKSGGVYLPSTYTQNIAKKLAEMDDDGDSEYGLGRLKKKKKRKGKGKNNASTSGLGKVGSNKNVSNQNMSKQNHDKSSYNDLDYMDVYTNATRNELGFSIPGSRIDVNGAYSTPISEKTILKDISRATKRVNFLKDLDFRMKKSKNGDGSVDIKETVIGVHQSYLQSGKPRIYGSSDNRVSMKSIQMIDSAEKSNLPSKPTKPKTTIRVHDIYDFSADRTMLNGSVTTKDSSFASRLYANQNHSQLSKTRLPPLKYDPQVDQEIISNMDALERLNKKMSRKAKDMTEKKEYIDLGIEIDVVRGSRKKSLQKHG